MSDKIVIVGATGYTGSTLALSLSKDEVSCHLVGRDHAKLQDLASKTNSSFAVCNIEDDQSVKDSLDTISNDKIVGLAYCIGSIVLKPFSMAKEDDYINAYKLNVIGAVRFIKHAYKKLAESNGSVVLFSTVAVDRGFTLHSVISSAKGAIQGLTTSLAAEFAPKVRVNCIAPSITDSKMAQSILGNEKLKDQIALKHALKRTGKPEDLAEIAKFLLSSSSSWITGQTIHVDGGKINIET